MDHYTMKALWIYWARGDDEVELTNEESSDSDDEDEVAKKFRIETNVFDFETSLCRDFKEFNYLLQIDPYVLTKDIDGFKTYEDYKDDWIYKWNKDVPWVHEKLLGMINVGEEKEVFDRLHQSGGRNVYLSHLHFFLSYLQVCFYLMEMNYMLSTSGCFFYFSDPLLLLFYFYFYFFFYEATSQFQKKRYICEALKDSKLKEEALKNKAIMEGMIDEDDESSNEGWRRWDDFDNTNHNNEESENEMEHKDEERCEVFDDH
ncbi:hypothetical protein Tco_1320471 [Tanacetum coccineum]